MKIIEEFQKIFELKIIPYILNLDFVQKNLKYYEPIIYTLKKRSNKFRSAVCLISAEICKIEEKRALPLAAASELIHSSIIIQDDLADNNQIRRKKQVAWKKFGTCYSLHSSLFAITDCIEMIDDNIARKKFLSYLQNVYKCQIGQNLLNLEKSLDYEEFLSIHLGKTAIGQWSITAPAVLAKNKKIEYILLLFSQKLGDAGTLKNDVEDFMKEGFKDVKTGAVTYPIYLYFCKCNPQEKLSFLRVFGKNIDFDYDYFKNSFISKGVYKECRSRINRLILEANQLLDKLPNTENKKLLKKWANYHKNI